MKRRWEARNNYSMKYLNLSLGLKWALYFLVLNLLLAIIAYFFWCLDSKASVCSVRAGIYWIRMHPVFPDFILYFPLLGFVVGTIEPILRELPTTLKGLLS